MSTPKPAKHWNPNRCHGPYVGDLIFRPSEPTREGVERIIPKEIGHIVKAAASEAESRTLRGTISAVYVRDYAIWQDENWSRYSSFWLLGYAFSSGCNCNDS